MPSNRLDDSAPGHGHTEPYGSYKHVHHHDDERHEWLTRTRHAISEVVGAQSHDTADQVDKTLETGADGRRALYLSLVNLLLTALLQAVVVVWSGSVALLGDTVHNFADALTAVPLLIAFRLALRSASERLTYGYGRAEDLAGVFVVATIALSSGVTAWEAVHRLLDPQAISHLGAVGIAAFIGFIGNEIVASYRVRVGKRIGSAALVADGLHARADGFTSLAVLLGVLGTALGWRRADPLVGLIITVAIVGVLHSALRQVGGRLMDAVDPALLNQAESVLLTTAGVRAVDDVKLRWVGHTLRAEVRVAVDPGLTFEQAHELAHRAEHRLQDKIHRMTAAAVHASPDAPGQSVRPDPG